MTGKPFTVEYTDVETHTRRRVRYEPGGDSWLRLEQEHTGCAWRTIGRERVTDVLVESLAAVAD